MLYFLHISKCAGSSFVSLAKENVRLFAPNANGNPIDPLTGIGLKFWRWSAAEQHYFLTSGEWDLVANETGMGREAEIRPGVVYATILRDPIDRLFSAYQFGVERPDKALTLEERGRKFAQFLQRNRRGTKWRRNYLIACLTHRERARSRERLELAKHRLAQFDLVFFLDTLAQEIRRLANYGWTQLELPGRRVASAQAGQRWSAAREALTGYPELLQELLEQNEQDMGLYAFAAGLPRNIAAVRPSDTPRPMFPDSANFEFLAVCAYEEFLKNDSARCREILNQMALLSEASAIDLAGEDFAEFALSRFADASRAKRDFQRRRRAAIQRKLSARKARILSQRP